MSRRCEDKLQRFWGQPRCQQDKIILFGNLVDRVLLLPVNNVMPVAVNFDSLTKRSNNFINNKTSFHKFCKGNYETGTDFSD